MDLLLRYYHTVRFFYIYVTSLLINKTKQSNKKFHMNEQKQNEKRNPPDTALSCFFFHLVLLFKQLSHQILHSVLLAEKIKIFSLTSARCQGTNLDRVRRYLQL